MKKTVQNLFLLLFTFIITLLFVEVLVRTFAPQPRYYAPQYLFTADEHLGYKFTPGFKGNYSTPENTVTIDINSKGLRDKEHGDKAGKRILGLGDSFVMGVGVEEEDTFLRKLESYLNLGSNEHVDVINAGVQGYGTDQEYSYLKTTGMKYQPDLIILSFYPNDVIDSILPDFTVKNGYLAVNEAALGEEFKRPLIDFNYIAGLIKNEIHLFRFIINRLQNTAFFKEFLLKSSDRMKKGRQKRTAIYAKKPEEEMQAAWDTTKNLIDRVNETAKAHKAKLLIVYIPERMQVYRKQWEEVKRQWELSDDEYDSLNPEKVIGEFCRKSEIPYLNLTPILEKNVKEGHEVYYTLDPHFSITGNEIAAKAIYESIREKHLLHASD